MQRAPLQRVRQSARWGAAQLESQLTAKLESARFQTSTYEVVQTWFQTSFCLSNSARKAYSAAKKAEQAQERVFNSEGAGAGGRGGGGGKSSGGKSSETGTKKKKGKGKGSSSGGGSGGFRDVYAEYPGPGR
jgi:hypothetical protein